MSLAGSVFQDHRNVLSARALSPEVPRPGRHAPPFPYRFYLDISREYPRPPLGPQWTYDLRAQPVAVCFQISTTEMFRPSARTNVVEIPAETIRAALAALP